LKSVIWQIFFCFNSLLFFLNIFTFILRFLSITFIAKFFLWKSSCIENFTSEVCYRKKITPLGSEFYSSSKIFKNTQKNLQKNRKKIKKNYSSSDMMRILPDYWSLD